MKKLFVIHSIKQFKAIKALYGDIFKDPNNLILAFTIEVRLLFQQKKIPYITEEQFMDEETMIKIDQRAVFITENWHKNAFKFIGLPFGIVSQKGAFVYFSKTIRNLHVFLKIIESEKPNEIIIIEDKNQHIKGINEVIQFVCSIKNVKLKILLSKKPTSSFIFDKVPTKKKKIKPLLILIGDSPLFESFLRILLKIIWAIQDLSWNRTKKRKKTVLILGKYYYHNSIVKELYKKHRLVLFDYRPNIFKRKDITHIFSKKKEGTMRFLDFYYDKHLEKQSNVYYEQSLKKWNKLLESENFKDIFTYEGISFWPIFSKKLSRILIKFKIYIIRFLISYRILTRNKYDSLIFVEDYKPTPRTLSYIGSKMNVPSIVIQHGIIGHYLTFLPTYCTKLAVWGEISKNYLASYGLGSNKMEITGTPRFDAYMNIKKNSLRKEKIKNSVYKYLKIDRSKKLYVLASTFNHFYKFKTSIDINHLENEKTLKMAFEAIKNLPNSHLVLKLHPGDYHEDIPEKIKEMLDVPNISIVSDYSIFDLIVACDCFITQYSTTAIEAMIMDKPVIIINFRKSGVVIPFDKYNIIYNTSNYEELINSMKQSLIKPVPLENYDKFLKDYIFKTDGLSSNRVIELINNLML